MTDHTPALVHQIYGYLRGKARMRSTVTYTLLQKELGIDRPYGALTPLLDECAALSLDQEDVVLPAIVVNKESGVPGGKFDAPTGFWKFCQDQGRDLGDNKYEFAVKEQVRVFEAYGS